MLGIPRGLLLLPLLLSPQQQPAAAWRFPRPTRAIFDADSGPTWRPMAPAERALVSARIGVEAPGRFRSWCADGEIFFGFSLALDLLLGS